MHRPQVTLDSIHEETRYFSGIRPSHSRRGEQGFASMELVLALPVLVFIMILMLNAGHAMMVRERA